MCQMVAFMLSLPEAWTSFLWFSPWEWGGLLEAKFMKVWRTPEGFLECLTLKLVHTEPREFINYTWSFAAQISAPAEASAPFSCDFLYSLVSQIFWWFFAPWPQFSGKFKDSCWFSLCLAFPFLWQQDWWSLSFTHIGPQTGSLLIFCN